MYRRVGPHFAAHIHPALAKRPILAQPLLLPVRPLGPELIKQRHNELRLPARPCLEPTQMLVRKGHGFDGCPRDKDTPAAQPPHSYDVPVRFRRPAFRNGRRAGKLVAEVERTLGVQRANVVLAVRHEPVKDVVFCRVRVPDVQVVVEQHEEVLVAPVQELTDKAVPGPRDVRVAAHGDGAVRAQGLGRDCDGLCRVNGALQRDADIGRHHVGAHGHCEADGWLVSGGHCVPFKTLCTVFSPAVSAVLSLRCPRPP